MENVTKLDSVKDRFEDITMSHDMTIKERERCRELVEEAKNKEMLRLETSFTELEAYPDK